MLTSWPELSWTISPQRTQWLSERTRQMGERARAFELALERASEAGEAPLSKVADTLETWEDVVANVWMYVGLEEGKQIAQEGVPSHAEELEKIWNHLGELRASMLQTLGTEAAQKVLAYERAAKVETRDLLERAGELPSFAASVDALGSALPQFTLTEPVGRPMTSDEFRQRQAAEAKTLPEPATLEALLRLLPAPWTQCAFETIGLELTGSGEDDSRTTLQRGVIAARLGGDRELLKQVVFALEDEDRALLSELIDAGGALRYADVTKKYGPDDADGFYWPDRPPSGTVARVRRVALGFVAMKDGRQVLAIPSDLIEPVTSLLR